jgi:adenylate kinase
VHEQPPLSLVLLGPPGAGKGTQAARLRGEFRLPYLSTGDLLRRHRADGSALGERAAEYMDRGRLVPDDIVIAMLFDAVAGPPRGFLLDGFPRTVVQADALEARLADAAAALSAVILIDVPDDLLVERISGRLTCPRGHVSHVGSRSARGGVCEIDGEPLFRREDDQPKTVRRRLAEYHEVTKPLEVFYEQRGILLRVDGSQTPDGVFQAICRGLAVGARL